MKIGIPAEIWPRETRVAATPETVKKLVAAKHEVVVQSGAGVGASNRDDAYAQAGASVVAGASDVYGQSELVLKVRPPQAAELALLKNGQVIVGMLNPFDTDGL